MFRSDLTTFLPDLAKSKNKYYVVWVGNNPGIYNSWTDCQLQIKGYAGAKYKAFKTFEAAQAAYAGSHFDYYGENKKREVTLSPEELAIIGQPVVPSIAVDAACSGNPGILEYRGVETDTKFELFRVGPFPRGTTNIGEFLAIVHGLAHLKRTGGTIPVYSDSKIALGWVRNKTIRTQLKRSRSNTELFAIVDHAVAWLKNNDYPNKLLKWETKAWGEIPADFGRK